MLDRSSPWLLRLAGPQLQSLSYTAWIQRVSKHKILPHLATLTALTKLELAHLLETPQPAELHSLRQLRLLELRIIDCNRLEESLIVPGALPTLRKLHVEEWMQDRFKLAKIMAEVGDYNVASEAPGFGRALLALPDLVEVSGHCPLSVFKILEDKREWKCVSRESRGPRVGEKKVWRKVS